MSRKSKKRKSIEEYPGNTGNYGNDIADQFLGLEFSILIKKIVWGFPHRGFSPV